MVEQNENALLRTLGNIVWTSHVSVVQGFPRYIHHCLGSIACLPC